MICVVYFKRYNIRVSILVADNFKVNGVSLGYQWCKQNDNLGT